MKKYLPAVLLLLLFFIVSPSQVVAVHRKFVLGTSTNSSPNIPPTVEGPGLLLPDSPLFFLDELKQQVRLFSAITSESKANIHADIAGERLAELRFMLARDNEHGVRTALLGIMDHLKSASSQVNSAKMSGKSVERLAKTINAAIETKQQALDVLEKESGGELRALVTTVQEGLLVAKVEVEDSLSADDLANEVRDDLERKTHQRMSTVTLSTKELQDDIAELNKQASEAAQKALLRREEALRTAITQKSESLRKEQERLLLAEKAKQDELIKVQKNSADQAAIAIQSAQEAAKKFQASQQAATALRALDVKEAASNVAGSQTSHAQ